MKITSLNTFVIAARLIISLFVQRALAIAVGEVGIAKIGVIRNLLQILTSTSSLGVFNGVVKYVSEFSDDNKKLSDLFSTTFVFVCIGSFITSLVMFFGSSWISFKLFNDLDFIWLIKLLAFLPLVVGVNRIFHGIVNGLSEYKKYAKIDLLGYILSVILLLICLYFSNIEGVLFAITITPIIQLIVLIYIFGSVLKKYCQIVYFKLKFPYAKELLAFALMSFVSTILINYIELDIRTMITNRINIIEAGHWTAINFISKNYMSFSSGIFTLYVIPKFARIYDKQGFFKEVLYIYKTLLPLFGIGMLLVYIFRNIIIDLIYPNFVGMEPLFKWQLMGDFVRLATLVLAHQFLAKKMVISFVFSELFSLLIFYVAAYYLTDIYGVEGVVLGHFIRSFALLIVVFTLVMIKFNSKKNTNSVKH
ncbi:O-antigen translocase [uncultured Algibacter sp.]|uniref:O-antigen translocase n=1 Tax=uncultured Algibacter sp. TaxID=298659 RepID=UPI0026119E7C|nr:O-antigen translocase [uncultured Algibacter sp.]